MFVLLMPLLKQRSLLITVARVEEKLKANEGSCDTASSAAYRDEGVGSRVIVVRSANTNGPLTTVSPSETGISAFSMGPA